MKTLGFIGTGNIASAIFRGVVKAGVTDSDNIYLYDTDRAKALALCGDSGAHCAQSAAEAASCDAVICAVKPDVMQSVLNGISTIVGKNSTLVISTAAGLELETLSGYCNGYNCIIRTMPNLNAAVGQSCTALCCQEGVTREQKDFALEICNAFGSVFELKETLFSAFTAVSGSAPAFVFEFIKSLAFAGVKHGIPTCAASEIAIRTVLGSAANLLECGEHPGVMIDKVCSPGGTTASGVASLCEFGFDNAVIKAVDATVLKSENMK